MPSQTPNVFTYPRQEPGTQGHLDLVEALRSLPANLIDELRGISEEAARYRPRDSGWCVKEIVGHLRDAAEIYHTRLYMMSTQTDPVLEPYDPDALAHQHGYAERPLAQMVGELRQWRADTVQLLTTLVNWNWARTGQHLEDGRLSIRQMVDHMIEHEAEHVEDIRRVRAEAEAAS